MNIAVILFSINYYKIYQNTFSINMILSYLTSLFLQKKIKFFYITPKLLKKIKFSNLKKLSLLKPKQFQYSTHFFISEFNKMQKLNLF